MVKCPSCSHEFVPERRPYKLGRPRVPCPTCLTPNGATTSEDQWSGYWRRHRCSCGTRYASVIRASGQIQVYESYAPKGTAAPYTPLHYEFNPDESDGQAEARAARPVNSQDAVGK